jgi:hypothetical protein
MKATDLEDLYELSPAQQGILFHCVQAPDSSVYATQSFWSMRGALDVPRFRRAWQHVLERHPALRSGVYWEGLDSPQQAVFRSLSFPFDVADWSERSAAEQAAAMRMLIDEDRRRHFRLSHPPLARLAVRRCGDDLWQCLWSRHHILFDGWSQGVVLRDVFTAYAAGGDGASLDPVAPYSAYIAWLRRQDRTRAELFWRRLFAGLAPPPPLHRAGIHPRPATATPRQQSIQPTPEEAAALTALLRRRGLTLTSLALGLWAMVLSRLTGVCDVVFGVTVSGRPPDLRGIESMVGLFINTLPLRVTVAADQVLSEWLRAVMTRQSDAAEYGYCSLVDIHAWSGVPRGQPLFESVVVAQNYPKPDPGMTARCGLDVSEFHSIVENGYPLTLRVSADDRCEFQLLYDAARVEPGVVQVLLTQLQAVVRQAVTLLPLPVAAAAAVMDSAEQASSRSATLNMLADIRSRSEQRNRTVGHPHVHARSELQS